MLRASIACALLVSGCSGNGSTTTPPGGSGGSGSGSSIDPGSGSGPTGKPDPNVTSCDAAKPKVSELYRAEGMTRKDAKRIDAYVDDNVTMVMADCAKQPAKMVACLASAATVAEIEKTCMEQLDDEGTEGDRLKK